MLKYISMVHDINYYPLICDENISLFKNIVIPKGKINVIFTNACIKGQFEFVKYIINEYTAHDINVHSDNEYAFRFSCRNGHLNVAQWLVDTFDDINIHIYDEFAFVSSCENGHLNVARWLVSRFKDINIYARNFYVFENICGT